VSEVRPIAITRVFDAPREAVWAAWTEPGQIAAWWGKRGWRTPVDSVVIDLRPGGAFALNSLDAEGREMPQAFTYREIEPPERLVFADAGGATCTVTFADLGGGRTAMSFRSTMRATAELLHRAIGGMQSAFDRLAEHLDPRSPA
jgi:uncharacterized protein YndB with AHSA1/START domain